MADGYRKRVRTDRRISKWVTILDEGDLVPEECRKASSATEQSTGGQVDRWNVAWRDDELPGEPRGEDHAAGRRGDAVLSGLLPSGNDIDVPEVAIGEAQRLGQLEPDAVCPSMPVRLVGELAPPLPGRRSSRRRPQ